MANDEHVALLKKGVAAWTAWRDATRAARHCRLALLQSAAGWLPTAAPHNELTRDASYTPRRFVLLAAQRRQYREVTGAAARPELLRAQPPTLMAQPAPQDPLRQIVIKACLRVFILP